MKTYTKWLMPVLAVATLLAAACDPFPSKNTSAPSVVRVIASGSNYVDTKSENVSVANPAAIALPHVDTDAFLFVQFNKDVDGSTIQATTNYTSTYDNVPLATACRMFTDTTVTPNLPGSPLTFGANWPAGSLVCYYPSSATDGGSIYVAPGDLLVLGLDPYVLSGTVKDYDGHNLSLNVSFNVTARVTAADASAPTASPPTFAVDLSWNMYKALGTTYQVERAPDVSGAAGAYAVIATGVTTTSATVTYTDTTVAQNTTYWYRVTTEAPATAFTYEVASVKTAKQGPPVITTIAPATGSIAGGTSVVITGTTFVSPTVTIDGADVAIDAQTATTITITTPPHAAGAVPVVVKNSDGQVSAAKTFTYAAP